VVADPGQPAPRRERLAVAAAGDIHCRTSRRQEVIDSLAGLEGRADLFLLAGDLTAHGLVEEAEVLAAACEPLTLPVCAVLGNHDWHEGCQAEIRSVLEEAGVVVLEGQQTVIESDGIEVGVVGVKGYVGGFPGSHLSDYGEDSLREVYRETTAEVEALERGLKEVAACDLRFVVMHYAPTAETLVGEPPGIWTFLGTDRLGDPLRHHEPNLVVHGHAHAGTFEGRVASVPVYNVSVPVLGRDYHLFEVPVPPARGVR
jgi:Icc-related predicted phosphoesterase